MDIQGCTVKRLILFQQNNKQKRVRTCFASSSMEELLTTPVPSVSMRLRVHQDNGTSQSKGAPKTNRAFSKEIYIILSLVFSFRRTSIKHIFPALARVVQTLSSYSTRTSLQGCQGQQSSFGAAETGCLKLPLHESGQHTSAANVILSLAESGEPHNMRLLVLDSSD